MKKRKSHLNHSAGKFLCIGLCMGILAASMIGCGGANQSNTNGSGGTSVAPTGQEQNTAILGQWVCEKERICYFEKMEFFSDGTYTAARPSPNYTKYTGNYSLDGNRLKLDRQLENVLTYTISVDDQILSLTNDDTGDTEKYYRPDAVAETSEDRGSVSAAEKNYLQEETISAEIRSAILDIYAEVCYFNNLGVIRQDEMIRDIGADKLPPKDATAEECKQFAKELTVKDAIYGSGLNKNDHITSESIQEYVYEKNDFYVYYSKDASKALKGGNPTPLTFETKLGELFE